MLASINVSDLNYGMNDWQNIQDVVRFAFVEIVSQVESISKQVFDANEQILRMETEMKENEKKQADLQYTVEKAVREQLKEILVWMDETNNSVKEKANNNSLLTKANRSEVIHAQEIAERAKKNTSTLAEQQNKLSVELNILRTSVNTMQNAHEVSVRKLCSHENQLVTLLSSGLSEAPVSSTTRQQTKTMVDPMSILLGSKSTNVGYNNWDTSSDQTFEYQVVEDHLSIQEYSKVTKIKSALRKLVDAIESKVGFDEFESALNEKANKASVASALSRKISKKKVASFIKPFVLEEAEEVIAREVKAHHDDTKTDVHKHVGTMKVFVEQSLDEIRFSLNDRVSSLENKILDQMCGRKFAACECMAAENSMRVSLESLKEGLENQCRRSDEISGQLEDMTVSRSKLNERIGRLAKSDSVKHTLEIMQSDFKRMVATKINVSAFDKYFSKYVERVDTKLRKIESIVEKHVDRRINSSAFGVSSHATSGELIPLKHNVVNLTERVCSLSSDVSSLKSSIAGMGTNSIDRVVSPSIVALSCGSDLALEKELAVEAGITDNLTRDGEGYSISSTNIIQEEAVATSASLITPFGFTGVGDLSDKTSTDSPATAADVSLENCVTLFDNSAPRNAPKTSAGTKTLDKFTATVAKIPIKSLKNASAGKPSKTRIADFPSRRSSVSIGQITQTRRSSASSTAPKAKRRGSMSTVSMDSDSRLKLSKGIKAFESTNNTRKASVPTARRRGSISNTGSSFSVSDRKQLLRKQLRA